LDDIETREAGAKRRNGNEPFFSADLPRGEIERILARIEENLSFRQTIRPEPQGYDSDAGSSVAWVVGSGDARTRLERMRTSWGNAPLFTIARGGRLNRIKRLINLLLKVVGRPQRRFNQETLGLFSELVSNNSTFAGSLAGVQRELRALNDRVERNLEHGAWLKSVAERLEGLEKWLGSVAEREEGSEKWVAAIQEEVRELAFEVREQKSEQASEPFQQKIVSPGDYQTKTESFKGEIKVNLGSGRLVDPDYINVDFREIPGVDVVADVRDMPFEEGSLAELASAHLVEHFREYEFKTRVLPYWRSLLKQGGRIRIVCPNWEATIEKHETGEMPLDRFKEITFGGQDYEGDDHFTMYTPATLSELLEKSGFRDVEVLAVDRDNNGCPEMELVAYKI
jgi:predicted SAM-dependent methyltransferase